MKKGVNFPSTVIVLALIINLLSCSNFYKKSADKEVYRIIKDKSEEVPGMPSEFSIEDELADVPEKFKSEQPGILSLTEAIETAVERSKDYQSRKESLYSKALSLTNARHKFDPLFSGKAAGRMKHENKVESLTGNFAIGMRQMLATGGDISVNLALTLFRYINSGAPMKDSGSTLSASFTQPLLRGMGRTVALENLTQSERSMVYSVRDFIRYRRKFSVDIAKQYFSVLNQREVMNNNKTNYDNLMRERERATLMSQAGRIPAFQVDQTEQNELNAKDNWISSKQSYEEALDKFKIKIGYPTEARLELDPNEMQNLLQKGTAQINIDLDKAIETALTSRLDYKTVNDEVYDKERSVKIAKNGLLPKADIIIDYSVSDTRPNRPFSYRSDKDVLSGGLDIDPMFDKKSERNIFRQSLIDYEAAKRNCEEAEDNIKLEVRNTFRNLEQAEKSFVIQRNSVSLAERRVESTTMLQEAGRASTRDVLDARESLLKAQNSLIRTLVDHFNARLDLFIAMETLKIDDKGLWMEETQIEKQ